MTTDSDKQDWKEDEFVQKHLKRIHDKYKELGMEETPFHSLCIEKLKHLQQPPFDASIKYFLETGKINGEFFLALTDLFQPLQSENERLKEELKKQSPEEQSEIAQLQYQIAGLRKDNAELKEEIKKCQEW